MDINAAINLSIAYSKVFLGEKCYELATTEKTYQIENLILFCHTFPLPDAAILIEDDKIVDGFVIVNRDYEWNGIKITRELLVEMGIQDENI